MAARSRRGNGSLGAPPSQPDRAGEQALAAVPELTEGVLELRVAWEQLEHRHVGTAADLPPRPTGSGAAGLLARDL